MQENKSNKILLIIIILLVLVIGGFLLFSKQKGQLTNETGVSGYVIGEGIQPGLTNEEIQDMLNQEVEASKISFSINSMPVFNGNVGRIVFANPPYSAHDIDLTISIDGKEIVKTGKIKPNQYIEEIELLESTLKKGEYIGTGIITAYNQETGEVIGQTNVEMNITVE